MKFFHPKVTKYNCSYLTDEASEVVERNDETAFWDEGQIVSPNYFLCVLFIKVFIIKKKGEWPNVCPACPD